jgi:hypothetical protein
MLLPLIPSISGPGHPGLIQSGFLDIFGEVAGFSLVFGG